MRRLIVPLALASLVVSACSQGDDAPAGGATARITTNAGDVTLHVEVADSADERARGLMGVTDLAADGGMAFLFDEPSTSGFWMKDTPLPLSIAFWDTNGRIVGLMDMPPCTADPCPTYRPDAAYVGALEAHRGFFSEHGVRMGDRVDLG